MGAQRPHDTKRPARGPRAKQSLGQNFLQDESLARRIAQALVTSDDGRVFELGPGQGAITTHLLERHPGMTAVEIDERMIEHLTDTLPQLRLEHGDLLKLDFEQLAAERGGRLSLVSNTPFYLTSPLLFKLIAATEHVEEAVLTTQKEVALKVLSPPNSKQYGILAIMLQLFGAPKLLFDLPPEAFVPAPKVTSSVLRFEPCAIPPGERDPLSPAQRAALLGILKLTFEARRKMLRVSLRRVIESGDVRPPPDEFLTKRPEQLSPSQWLELARSMLGDDLGESRSESTPVTLERHTVNKGWRAHKAGYRDDSGKDGAPGAERTGGGTAPASAASQVE